MVNYKNVLFNFKRLINALFLVRNKASFWNFIYLAELTKFNHPVSVSWSQAGEDVALLSVFKDRTDGLYIDVGSHHPSRFSITRHLYQLGWHGVNVEANPELIPEFEKFRKRDLNLCVAVGMRDKYNFTIFEEPALSTFNDEWRTKFVNEKARVSKTMEITGRKLRSILDEFEPENAIDLLSIDAEGSDLEVLQSLEGPTLEIHRFPRWLLLEAAPPVSEALKTPAVRLAMEWGYTPYFVLPMSTLMKFEG
jgi:FkbM family methyltransferase